MAFPLTFPALLAQRARLPTPAVYDRGRPLSYAALQDESRRVAAGLKRLGVGEGDRVALWLPNVTAWLASFFACAQLGAIAVAVNTRFRSREIADILGRSGCKTLVFWPGFKQIDFAGILAACDAQALERLESLVLYGEDGAPAVQRAIGKPAIAYATLAAGAPLAAASARPANGCAIFTTSGTTKAPKFVLHDQRTLIAHAFDVVRGFGIDRSSVMLLAPPLCGVFGFCGALAAIAAGRPVTMMPVWDAAAAARQIDAHGVTHFNATDDAIDQLLAQNARTPVFPSLRLAGYANFNPAQNDIVARGAARGLTLFGLYGTSEIQALFARQSEHAPLAERMLGGGQPVSSLAQVRARDPQSGAILEHGAAGELEFLAPNSRMVEYYGNPQATREALTQDGWYRSGDLGYTQADGRFVYLTRMGDSLRLGGFLVSPAEIEGVVQELPGIGACQVVGVAGAAGLQPGAFAVLAPGAALDEQAVKRHLASRLASYKVPVRVFAIDAFPVTDGTNASKIKKHELRELACARIKESQPKEE